jgi:hypothetical protein
MFAGVMLQAGGAITRGRGSKPDGGDTVKGGSRFEIIAPIAEPEPVSRFPNVVRRISFIVPGAAALSPPMKMSQIGSVMDGKIGVYPALTFETSRTLSERISRAGSASSLVFAVNQNRAQCQPSWSYSDGPG